MFLPLSSTRRRRRRLPPPRQGEPQLGPSSSIIFSPTHLLFSFLLFLSLLASSTTATTTTKEGSCSADKETRAAAPPPLQGAAANPSGPASDSPPFLASFLGPEPGLSNFLQHFWQKKPTVQRRRSPTYFLQILSKHEVDNVLEFGVGVVNETSPVMVQGEDYKLVKRALGPDKEFWSGSPSFNSSIGAEPLAKSHDAFNRGFSLVINFMEQRWTPIGMLAAAIEDELGYRASVNLYLTPGQSQGFEAHFDWMDVFVMQVEGRKVWKLYDALVELPRPDLKFKPSKSQVGDPFIEFTLEAGDTLYMPAGLVHEAHTIGMSEPSMHITVGVETTMVGSWESLVFHVVSMLTEGATKKDLKCVSSQRGGLKHRLQAPVPDQHPPLKYGDLVLAALLHAGRKELSLRRAVPYTPIALSEYPTTPLYTLHQEVVPGLERHMKNLTGALVTPTPGSFTTRGSATFAGEAMIERLEAAYNVTEGGVKEWEVKSKRMMEEGTFVELVDDLLCIFRSKKGAKWVLKTFEEMAREDLLVRRRKQMANLERCGYSSGRQRGGSSSTTTTTATPSYYYHPH